MVNKYPHRPCDDAVREWFPHDMEHISFILKRVMEKLYGEEEF